MGKICKNKIQKKTENVWNKNFSAAQMFIIIFIYFYAIVFVLENYFFPKTRVQFQSDVNVDAKSIKSMTGFHHK